MQGGRAIAAGAVGLMVLAAGAVGWAWRQGSVGVLPIREHCTAAGNGTTTELDPEQTGNAATIAAVAVRRGLPGRAASIGIATAMTESKLRNLTYGDRDSLGLFQQRPSQGWGTPAQVQDPVYATNAFYDVLVKIEGYQNLAITDAAQKVQRSGYPGAYAEHEPQARIFASALSGYSPGALACVLQPVAGASSPAPSASSSSSSAGSALTDRATAVLAAAKAETGRTGTGSDPTGTRLRFTVPASKDADRLAWAFAQWAVARAGGLDVVAVEVGGRQWQRDRPDLAWTATTATTAVGTVLVTVAPGG